jgi:hypothetical protein
MKPAIKFGLWGGAILSILLFAGYSLEWYKASQKWTIWTIINVIIFILTIFFGVRESRKLKPDNTIGYRNAVSEGIKIIMLIAAIHSATIFFYFTISQTKFSEYKKYTTEKNIEEMKKAGANETLINENKAEGSKNFTPFNFAKDNFVMILLMGLFFALITASVLRKKGDQIPEIKK